MNTFGEYLKSLRKDRKLTLVQLAEKTGLSQPYLSQIENNKRGKQPTVEIVNKLASALNVSKLTLLEKAGLLEEETASTLNDVKDILNNNQWRQATPDEIQKDMKKQKELLTRDIEELLTGSYFIEFKGRVLQKKEKQKILALIETILD